tara:strand:+ start:386 stop:523 length:138 start_codon:yes stop_codon:yes gene_type:complete
MKNHQICNRNKAQNFRVREKLRILALKALTQKGLEETHEIYYYFN